MTSIEEQELFASVRDILSGRAPVHCNYTQQATDSQHRVSLVEAKGKRPGESREEVKGVTKMNGKLDKAFFLPTALVGFVLLAGSTSHAVNEIEWRLAEGNGYSQQTGELRRNEWETLEDFAKRIIPQGMQLAHRPLEGNFGPSKMSLVILFEADEAAAKSYEGWVLVPSLTSYVKYDLPKPDVTWSIEEPKAVFFANADKDSAQELFIIGECYTGIGPTGAQPFNRTRVYDWNGSGFTHLETVSTKIGTAATARAVQKKLKSRP